MNIHKLFFYYRSGYALYLAQIFAAMNTMILVFYTAGDRIGIIQDIFPNFGMFIIFAISVGVPTIITIGYFHYKHAYKSEAEVAVQNNPYQYKLPPGHATHVTYPLYMEMIQFLKESAVNQESKKRLLIIEGKLQTLMDGGKIGL